MLSLKRHSDQTDSESTQLLTSNSCSSDTQVTFRDFDTGVVSSSPDVCSSRYGSTDNSSVASTMTLLPHGLTTAIKCDTDLCTKKSGHSAKDTLSPKHVASPLNFVQDRCYDLYNIDLLLEEKQCSSSLQSDSKDTKPKQNSVVTIFSIWNTILGSSLLTMPWGILMAGLIPGIILILAMSALCLYTAHKLLQVHKYHGGGERIEVIELSRVYLFPWVANVAKVFSISVLLGATIAYWILMSNFLYFSVNFVYDIISGKSTQPAYNNESIIAEVLCPKKDSINSTSFERSYDNLGPSWDLFRTVPVFLAIITFPLLNFNSPTFFTKFNSLGTASIVYLVIFVVVKSASWGVNMNNETWKTSLTLRATFPVLSGMLSLSFFIHNIIISIMESNRDQRKNGRDLTIAYILVTLTYTVVGITFYLCFPLGKSCIEDNLLNNFQKSDTLTVAARMVLLFQLLTVYPLIAYMLRMQLLSSMCKQLNSTRGCTVLVNAVIVTICVLFAIFLPRVGTIIRYTGAVSGLIYIFTLPCLLHFVITYRQGKLTMLSIFLHACIPLIGLLNFISQFIINES